MATTRRRREVSPEAQDRFIERLKALRQEQGMSARALSAKAGLTVAHVALIESGGRGAITVPTAYRLAHALGVPIDELFDEGRDYLAPNTTDDADNG